MRLRSACSRRSLSACTSVAGWNIEQRPVGARSTPAPRIGLRSCARELIEGNGLDPQPESVLVGPGHEEQVVREQGEAVGLLRRRAHCCTELTCKSGASERELELGLQESEGRA